MAGDLGDPKKKRRKIEAMVGKCVCPVSRTEERQRCLNRCLEEGTLWRGTRN